MARKRRVRFERLEPTDPAAAESILHCSPQDDNGELTRPRRKPAFIPYHRPTTVVELLTLGSMASLLAQGLVFIHNKRDVRDSLIEVLCSYLNISSTSIQTHTVQTDELLPVILELEPVEQRPVVVVIETTHAGQDVSRLCEEIAKLDERPCGVWLLGFVEDVDRKVLSLFHALFAFDCSDHEWQILRSVIDVADNPQTLRAEPSRKVLFFLNSGLARDAPLLDPNPIVLDVI